MIIQEQQAPIKITAKKRKRYAWQLMQNIKRWDIWEDEYIRKMLRVLDRAKNEMMAQFGQQIFRAPGDEASEFELFRIRIMLTNLDRLYDQLEAELTNLTEEGIQTAFRKGLEDVVEPIKSLGYTVKFFNVTSAQLNALADFNAALVKDITTAFRKVINLEVRNATLGVIRPLDAMANITKKLGFPTKPSDPTEGVAYRAERIVRTETNRVYNMATYSQQLALQKDFPELGKTWVATGDIRVRDGHLFAHRQTVPVKEPFKIPVNGKVEKLMYPTDPIGSPRNVIQCRCRSVTAIPGIEIAETPLDKRVKAEQIRRQKK